MTMKVYVDRMPKGCVNCPCCSISKSKPEYVEDWDYLYCNPLKQGMRWKPQQRLRLKDCPLRSLSEHTKQVRKEVCEKFVEEFMIEYTMGNESVEDIIYKVSDRIQGLTAEKCKK